MKPASRASPEPMRVPYIVNLVSSDEEDSPAASATKTGVSTTFKTGVLGVIKPDVLCDLKTGVLSDFKLTFPLGLSGPIRGKPVTTEEDSPPAAKKGVSTTFKRGVLFKPDVLRDLLKTGVLSDFKLTFPLACFVRSWPW